MPGLTPQLPTAIAVFFLMYLVNATYISVFYHRALTHKAIALRPWVEAFIGHTGVWVTGLDPKTWCCMHRLHHLHSDTERDPHSPVFHGVAGTFPAQIRSYIRIARALVAGCAHYTSQVQDLPFPVSRVTRKWIWLAPHLVHGAVAYSLFRLSSSPAVAVAYYLGLMTHPVEGWLVNAFGHHSGYRNFETPDASRNNLWVAWLLVGEGFQNNHHARPSSPNFAARPGEIDLGFLLCRLVSALGLTVRDPMAPADGSSLPAPRPPGGLPNLS